MSLGWQWDVTEMPVGYRMASLEWYWEVMGSCWGALGCHQEVQNVTGRHWCITELQQLWDGMEKCWGDTGKHSDVTGAAERALGGTSK